MRDHLTPPPITDDAGGSAIPNGLDLAVIIVTWNNRDLIGAALGSLYADLAASGLNAVVVVVDSASTDGTAGVVAAEFPQTLLVPSADNLGFARANNLGLREIGFWGGRSAADLPEAVYLLNPDTITSIGAVRALFSTLMSSPTVGVVGPRLTYGDGTFQHSAFGFPGLRQLWTELFPTPGRLIESRFNGRYPRERYSRTVPFPVDFMLGAAMMLRREVVEATHGFDEAFFMYCEEVDWGWRIHDAGWQTLCVPMAHVVHLGGQSTGQIRAQSVINLWRSRLILYDKHYPIWKRALARWLVRAGMTRRRVSAPPDLADAYATIVTLAE